MTSRPTSPGRYRTFRDRFWEGLRRPGFLVAGVAGLALGVHGDEAIDSRGPFLTVTTGLATALLWVTVWLGVRALLTRFVDLGHPTVRRGYLGGMALMAAITFMNLAIADMSYLEGSRYATVTLFVTFTVLGGGLPGLLLGHLVARGRAALGRRKGWASTSPTGDRRPDIPAPQMLSIGDPYPHGPVEDVRPTQARGRTTRTERPTDRDS